MEKQSPSWFAKADNTILRIYKIVSYFAAACLIAIMLIAFINVVGEKLAKAGLPIRGINYSADVIAYLHVPIVFLSAGFITLERGHTCVDILTNKLSATVQRITQYLSMLLGIAITGFITYRGFASLLVGIIQRGSTINTNSFSMPQWPFALAYCIGMALLTFSFVWALLRLIFHYSPPPFVDPEMQPSIEGGDAQ